MSKSSRLIEHTTHTFTEILFEQRNRTLELSMPLEEIHQICDEFGEPSFHMSQLAKRLLTDYDEGAEYYGTAHGKDLKITIEKVESILAEMEKITQIAQKMYDSKSFDVNKLKAPMESLTERYKEIFGDFEAVIEKAIAAQEVIMKKKRKLAAAQKKRMATRKRNERLKQKKLAGNVKKGNKMAKK